MILPNAAQRCMTHSLIRKECVLLALQGNRLSFSKLCKRIPSSHRSHHPHRSHSLRRKTAFTETHLGKPETSAASHNSTGSLSGRNNETPYWRNKYLSANRVLRQQMQGNCFLLYPPPKHRSFPNCVRTSLFVFFVSVYSLIYKTVGPFQEEHMLLLLIQSSDYVPTSSLPSFPSFYRGIQPARWL